MIENRFLYSLSIVAFGAAVMAAAYGPVLGQRRSGGENPPSGSRDERNPPPKTTPAPGNPADSSPGRINNAPPRLFTPLEGTSGVGISDRAMEAKVRRSIFGDAGAAPSGRAIRVSSFSGMVTLRGEVRTAQEKELLGADAERVAGAGNVSNEIVVRP